VDGGGFDPLMLIDAQRGARFFITALPDALMFGARSASVRP